MSDFSCVYTHVPKKRGPRSSRLRGVQSAHENLSVQTSAPTAAGYAYLSSPNERPAGPSSACMHPTLSTASTGYSGIEAAWSLRLPAVSPSSTPGGISITQAAQNIHDRLIDFLNTSLPGTAVEGVVNACISSWMQYAFPIAPVCHEATLRAHASLKLWPAFTAEDVASPWAFNDQGSNISVGAMRAFTLVTAVCGSVSYKVPPNILPHGSKLAPAFYRSSWEMLKLYEEYDIEFPQSTSVTIRLIHSSCLHHIGKTKASWHVLNQALLLAKDLVPCEQHLLAVRDPIEALLLRHNFWISLTSARSGMLLGDYPIGQHMTLMESGLEPSFTGGEEASLLDVTKFHNRPPFEKCLREGVNICRRLWAAATKVIFNISTSASRQNITLAARPKSLVELMETYLVFASVLDGLPSWLHRPDAPEADGADVSLYQSRCFWAQRTDLLISFHCLKLIILRHCVKHDLRVVLGLSNDPLALALRRLEIAQEFLGVIEGVPFTSLQLIGESCVEKIRQVGAVLLELMENGLNKRITDLSRACLSRLLDILASLNSRVSDELSSDLCALA